MNQTRRNVIGLAALLALPGRSHAAQPGPAQARPGADDASAELNKALEAAAKMPGKTLTLKGEYQTSTLIKIPAGVTVEGGSVRVSGGVWQLMGGARLRGTTLIDVQGRGFKPVVKAEYRVPDTVVDGCTIQGGTGIWLNASLRPTVVANTITSVDGYPIFCDGMEGGKVRNNQCSTRDGYGIQMAGTLIGNEISGNTVAADGKTKTGIIILSSAYGAVVDNKIFNNTVTNVSEEGVSVDYNSPFVYGQLQQDYRGGSTLECSLEGGDRVEVDYRTLVVLNGREAGSYAIVTSAGRGRTLQIKRQTFTTLDAGTRIGIGWAPIDTLIEGNKVSRAGRTGIMLYGSQVGTIVRDNEVADSGFADNIWFNGRRPYLPAGISALTIGQAKHESPLNGCTITRNRVRNGKVGIAVGVALWDGPKRQVPARMKVDQNSCTGCERGEIID